MKSRLQLSSHRSGMGSLSRHTAVMLRLGRRHSRPKTSSRYSRNTSLWFTAPLAPQEQPQPLVAPVGTRPGQLPQARILSPSCLFATLSYRCVERPPRPYTPAARLPPTQSVHKPPQPAGGQALAFPPHIPHSTSCSIALSVTTHLPGGSRSGIQSRGRNPLTLTDLENGGRWAPLLLLPQPPIHKVNTCSRKILQVRGTY